jgi:hypothetical protein
MDEHFDADEILREPEDFGFDFDQNEDNERKELILGQDRILDPEEVPIDDEDLYNIYE